MKLKEFIDVIKLSPVTKEVAKQISQYKLGLITKNKENSEFMTSPYIGIHKIVFTDSDKDNLFLIAGVFEDEVMRNIKKLEYIDTKWKVASNPFNFLCSVMIHQAHQSKLPKKIKETLIKDLAIILQFKMLTSSYSHYFKHHTKLSIVKAAYERLSNKTMHKRYGSNYNVLDYRASLLIENKTHIKHLNKNNVQSVVYLIVDMSNSIRSVLRHWYKHLLQVMEDGETITNTSVISRGDEGEILIDVIDSHTKYLEVIEDKIINEYQWIRKDRIDLLLELIPRADKDKVVKVLRYMHTSYLDDPKEIGKLLEDIITVCIKHLYVKKTLYPPYVSRTGLIIKYLKNLFSSSSPDPLMKKTKKRLSKVSADALSSRSKQINLSVAIIVAVYVFMISIEDKKAFS